jgi:ribosomal protein S18 acetylase RimI-like enzyme
VKATDFRSGSGTAIAITFATARRSVKLVTVDPVEIRRAEPGDASFIEVLSREVFSEYTPRAGPRTVQMSTERGARTLIATIGPKRVGFAVIVARGPHTYLDAIAVRESERGRGVGKRLLKHVEAEARAAGSRAVALVTADSNLAALDLFLRSGFKITARHARFYPRGQSALRLEKRVTD